VVVRAAVVGVGDEQATIVVDIVVALAGRHRHLRVRQDLVAGEARAVLDRDLIVSEAADQRLLADRTVQDRDDVVVVTAVERVGAGVLGIDLVVAAI
ncbi:Uncharacterized protein APZ42_005493, partial [Daphnia magna]